MSNPRLGLLAAGLLIAGCGTLPHTLPVATRTVGHVQAASANRGGPSITGISGDGRVDHDFSIWQGGSLELKALVSNPTNQPLTYHWDTDGGGWSDVTQPEFEFVSEMWGDYQATCTIQDATGKALDSKSVTIDVMNIPTPPPFPPGPPIPPGPHH